MRFVGSVLFAICAAGIAGNLGCAIPQTPIWKPLVPEDIDFPLSLAESVRLAMANDVRRAEWKARLNAAKSALISAREIPNPSVQLTWEGLGLHDDTGASLVEKTYGISYPILFWWPRKKDVEAARADVSAERATIREERRNLSVDVGTFYLELVVEKKKIALIEGIVESARAALAFVEETRRLGSSSSYDVRRAQADLMQAEGNLRQARNKELIDRVAFAFALGMNRPFPIEIDEKVTVPRFEIKLNSEAYEIPHEITDKALDASPALARAREELHAAQARYQAEVRRRLPLTDVQGSAGRRSQLEGRSSLFSLDIPIPLFNWNRSGVARAEAELGVVQAAEERIRREILARLSSEWTSYVTSRRQYDSVDAPLLEQRKRLSDDANELFKEGRIGYLNLLQSRRDWLERTMTALDSWRDLEVSAWRIWSELGGKSI